MKKLFAILAVAMLVVACGGAADKDEPKTIEDQLLDYVAQFEKAFEAGDIEAAGEAIVALDEWAADLDGEDYKAYEDAVEKHRELIEEAFYQFDEMMMFDDYGEDGEEPYAYIQYQYSEFLDEIEAALWNEDYDAVEAAFDSFERWSSSLSEAEMEAFEEASEMFATRTMRIANALQ